ncbi:MAG: hypothetical protein LBS62_03060 [Clostridiales bacterium]|jgi:hypothetical protein|nr:hypothetical protein [Clostridiales bacterium]
MFGTDKTFDLCAFPFSGRDAYFAIREDEESRELYLYFSRSPSPEVERGKLIRIVPVFDNKEDTRWTYSADAGSLTLRCTKGTVEFCFQRGNLLRIRAKGASLRMVCDDLKIYENAAPREDGSLEIAYEILGKFLLVPISGSLRHDALWSHKDVRTKEFTVDLLPDAATGICETAMHEYYSNGVRDQRYSSFDEAAQETRDAFEAFAARVCPGAEGFEEAERLAAYTLYTLHLPAGGHMRAPGLAASKRGNTLAVGWQQAIAAAALGGSPEDAYELLISPFKAQDAQGQVPNGVSFTWEDYVTAGAPMQGFAVCFLLDGGFVLSKERAGELYKALKRYADWFRAERCGGDLRPCYYHPEESGWLDATIFLRGLPLQSADLYAWLSLLYEACGRLARLAGIAEDGETSARLAEQIRRNMEALWKEDHFICKNLRTGFEFKANSVLRLLPVMLGRRLNGGMLEALAAEIRGGAFYTDAGVVSERLGSQEFSLEPGGMLRGGIVPAVQFVAAAGLRDGGKRELAAEIARRVLTLACEKGLGDAIPPFDNDPWTGKALLAQEAWRPGEPERRKDLLRTEKKEPKTSLPFTAAGAAGILGLARILAEK